MAYLVNLKALLQTGRLGEIYLGQLEREVFNILGTPDFAHAGTRKLRRPSLFSYGDLEFYFEDSSRQLSLINLNFLSFWQREIPSGGEKLQIEPWVLKAGLAPEGLIKYLNQEAINFCDVEPINIDTRQLLINKMTTLIFNNMTKECGDYSGLCKLSVGE